MAACQGCHLPTPQPTLHLTPFHKNERWLPAKAATSPRAFHSTSPSQKRTTLPEKAAGLPSADRFSSPPVIYEATFSRIPGNTFSWKPYFQGPSRRGSTESPPDSGDYPDRRPPIHPTLRPPIHILGITQPFPRSKTRLSTPRNSHNLRAISSMRDKVMR